ncbi:MAG: outer membrane beta-barrel domain-containing protein [Deltaproteobacteria bacterium]|nr:outer membrane beta-barrel domain-containing protein [Deltaproteobacteria bacterium]
MAPTLRTTMAAFAVGLALAGPTRAEETTELALEEPGATPDAAAAPADGADAKLGATESTEATESGKTATDEGIDLTLQDRIKAVARKTFLKAGRFELDPMVQVTVNDAFIRTWSVGGRAAWHINDAFALELGGGWVPPGFTQRLEPAELLKEKLALINIDNQLVGMADIGLTFSPLYGKGAVFGDGIVNFDGFLSAAVGATFDNGQDVVHPAMTVGIGTRVFLTRWLVLRGDVRNTLYPQEKSLISTLQNLLFVGVGVGFYLPPDFAYQYEAARVNPNG